MEEYGKKSFKESLGAVSYKSIEKLYGFTVKIRDNGRDNYTTVLKEI